MSTPTHTVRDVALTTLCCNSCGVRFAIDTEYLLILEDHQGGCEEKDGEEEGGWFMCPNGHRQRFIDSSAKRLGEQLAQYKHKLEQAEARIHQLERAAINAKIGRSLKRSKAAKRRSTKS